MRGISVSIFLSYWNAYANEEEAKDSGKTQWSQASLAAGIVRKALRCLAIMMRNGEEGSLSLEELGNGLISVPSHSAVNGLRCSLLAVENVDQQTNSTFIRDIMDRSREAFSLCVLPAASMEIWPLASESIQTGAANIIPLYPVDLDALAAQKINIYDLIIYKLYRRLILDKPDVATQFDPRLINDFVASARKDEKTLEDLDALLCGISDDPQAWVEHPLYSRTCSALDLDRGCLLIGPSSSGKSVLAFQVGRSYLLRGGSVDYFNLGLGKSNFKELIDIFYPTTPESSHSLVIIDDLQSNPPLAKFLLASASVARRCSLFKPPAVLAISWIDFSREAAAWFEDCLPVAVRPHQIRQKLIHRYRHKLSERSLQQLVNVFGDDIFLLRQSLEQSDEEAGLAQPAHIAESIWKNRTDESKIDKSELTRIALVVGSLGRFDLSTPPGFLYHEAHTTQDAIEKLILSGLLRRHQNKISMGHRSLCSLLSDWLEWKNGWGKLYGIGGPKKTSAVVLDYLRSLGSSLAVDILRALHARAGFKDRPKLNCCAAALVELWEAFNAVLERIEHQQSADATWGNVPSSAMFAVRAFAEVGKPDLFKKSIGFLGRHWRITKRGIEVITTGLATQDDFEQIHLAMREEDSVIAQSEDPYASLAKDIDIDRFHRTWVLGLILCAEAVVNSPENYLDKLANCVEQQQLNNGAFYPARVPWCTARVLLGLAACGRTIDTSPAVESAVNWLLRDRSEGGACSAGLWHSGTGKWNSTLETTGMVLLALAAVGYDCADRCLDAAQAYLLSQRNRWTAPGNELDGALAIQAFLDTGGEWEEVASETQALSRWAKGEALWQGATRSAKESLDQSCKVAQVASHLISIGWTAIQSDLPAFLDALATINLFRNGVIHGKVKRPAGAAKPVLALNGTASTADLELETIRKVRRISLPECTIVGAYRRQDERIRNQLKDWRSRIERPILSPTNGRENFLIWAAPGSGKSFFVQEIAKSLGDQAIYFEINLARSSRDEFCSQLNRVIECKCPALCLLDEIDARGDETWPYEECFSLLDLNTKHSHTIVFVLIGSSAAGLKGMIQIMLERTKGQDLLDRIPEGNRFEIPGLSLNDRVVIAASQIISAADERQQKLNEIEKLALYYLLKNKELRTPRQLRDLAVTAIQRMSVDDDRLKYDDFFYRGDNRNQQFWVEHQDTAAEISNVFVCVEG